MAFVTLMKAMRLPSVIARYAKQAQFIDAAEREARGSAVWAKWPGGGRKGNASIKVNSTAIPNVRPMNPGGKVR
jgi:hypothetical protein